MGNAQTNEKIKNFFIGVGKFLAKAATTMVLKRIAPTIGPGLATVINGLYAVGSDGLEIQTDKINKQIVDKVPDSITQFTPVNSIEQLKALAEKFPDQAKKAGVTVDNIDKVIEKAAMAKGGTIKGTPIVATMAKGGAIKAKKPRSAAQAAATAKMLAALKASKGKK